MRARHAVLAVSLLALAACGGNKTRHDGPPSGSARIPDLPAVSEGIAEDIATHFVWVAEGDDRIIGGIVLLLFGSRLPSAAKSLGQSFSAFKKGIKEGAVFTFPS